MKRLLRGTAMVILWISDCLADLAEWILDLTDPAKPDDDAGFGI